MLLGQRLVQDCTAGSVVLNSSSKTDCISLHNLAISYDQKKNVLRLKTLQSSI